jgi:hypothetical protein
MPGHANGLLGKDRGDSAFFDSLCPGGSRYASRPAERGRATACQDLEKESRILIYLRALAFPPVIFHTISKQRVRQSAMVFLPLPGPIQTWWLRVRKRCPQDQETAQIVCVVNAAKSTAPNMDGLLSKPRFLRAVHGAVLANTSWAYPAARAPRASFTRTENRLRTRGKTFGQQPP